MGAKLPDGEGKRHGLSFRTTRELQDKLRAAAAQSGRSIAHEAELRLEASFASDKPSLTAEDVRQIVRAEMGRGAGSGNFGAGWVVPAHMLSNGRSVNGSLSDIACGCGPHSTCPRCLGLTVAAGQGPFTPGARADRQVCRDRGCVNADQPWVCGQPDCPQGL